MSPPAQNSLPSRMNSRRSLPAIMASTLTPHMPEIERFEVCMADLPAAQFLHQTPAFHDPDPGAGLFSVEEIVGRGQDCDATLARFDQKLGKLIGCRGVEAC